MAERRPLIEGLKHQGPPVAPEMEKSFVFGGSKPAAPEPASVPTPTVQTASVPSRVPISTRLRADYAAALKRASLERQLNGIEPNALQDILEQAVEPWLRSNGYLK
jgi:hypothetical protein